MSDRRSHDGPGREVEDSMAGASGAGDHGQALANAAQSFGFFAALFVCLPESWPVFMSFARAEGIDQRLSRDDAMELLDWLAGSIERIPE